MGCFDGFHRRREQNGRDKVARSRRSISADCEEMAEPASKADAGKLGAEYHPPPVDITERVPESIEWGVD
jgi:hypothetical protein